MAILSDFESGLLEPWKIVPRHNMDSSTGHVVQGASFAGGRYIFQGEVKERHLNPHAGFTIQQDVRLNPGQHYKVVYDYKLA